MKGLFAAEDDDRVVWPHPEGEVYGDAIEPLCRSAPLAASRDPVLHRRLALIDAFRVGRARERMLAARALGEELGA